MFKNDICLKNIGNKKYFLQFYTGHNFNGTEYKFE